MKWKIIPRCKDYKISEYGDVKRKTDCRPNGIGKRKYKKGYVKTPNSGGPYLIMELCINGKCKPFMLHKLVLEAFEGPCPNGYQGNHKDLNKRNNHISNLEWVTPKENAKHAYDNGVMKNTFKKGEKHKLSKLTQKEVLSIKKLIKAKKLTQKEIGKIFGVCNTTISHIKTKRLWSWL